MFCSWLEPCSRRLRKFLLDAVARSAVSQITPQPINWRRLRRHGAGHRLAGVARADLVRGWLNRSNRRTGLVDLRGAVDHRAVGRVIAGSSDPIEGS